MKINSYLLFAVHVLLLSYTFAVDTSKQEATAKEAKEAAELKEVQVKADGGTYGVNYGGGGGGGNYGGGGGGGGWGGGCHHGCCYRGHGGSCNRCCSSPEEAKAFAENKPEAREVSDTNKVEAKGDEGKYGVNYGGGGGNYGGGGGNYGGGGGGGWGGGCRHGCCYRGHGGSCNRCCFSPEEAKEFEKSQPEAKDISDTKNIEAKDDGEKYGVNYGGGGGNYGGGGGNYGGGGGGWGGGCHHGCCYRGHGGSCNRCCSSPEEAKALAGNKPEAKVVADTNKVEAKGDGEKYGVNYGGGGGNYGGGGGNYGGGGGGWGGGCHHGCCYRGHGGSCNRCCSSPEEAKAFAEKQSSP